MTLLNYKYDYTEAWTVTIKMPPTFTHSKNLIVIKPSRTERKSKMPSRKQSKGESKSATTRGVQKREHTKEESNGLKNQ